jgi:hypothetical protein
MSTSAASSLGALSPRIEQTDELYMFDDELIQYVATRRLLTLKKNI